MDAPSLKPSTPWLEKPPSKNSVCLLRQTMKPLIRLRLHLALPRPTVISHGTPGDSSRTPELHLVERNLASPYVLCPYCSYSCPRFQRAEVETKRIKTGVILVNILANVQYWKSWFSCSALLLPNHDSRPHHVINHMTLSVIFNDAIHIMKALLIIDKSFICYWLAYWSLSYNMTHTWFFHVLLHSTMLWDHTSTNSPCSI